MRHAGVVPVLSCSGAAPRASLRGMDLDTVPAALFEPLRPPPDGRQSAAAAAIARGTMRALRATGIACVTELPLASGRRADIVGIDPRGRITIVEVKSCLDDFRTDRKWRDYRADCDHLLFAVDHGFPAGVLPEDTGLIVADAYGARILRPAPAHPLTAAARKAMTLRIARAGAARLQVLADPDLAAEPR